MINLNNWQQLPLQIRKNQHTPLVIAIIFGLLILLSAWQLINIFKSEKTKPIPTPTVKSAHTINIAQLHLMGIYDAKTADIPLTQLQLTLQGTVVVADDPTQSRALIQSPNQPTKVYKIGDFVPGNAKVEKIEQTFVLINDNGQLQKLRLPIQTLPNIQLSGN